MKSILGFTPHDFRCERQLFLRRRPVPMVQITPAALNRMFHYVDHLKTEVGWLGTAQRIGDDILIEEVFLVSQHVTSVTTEITASGLLEFYRRFNGTRPEVLDHLRFWGHSHVNMGTSPSQADEDQMQVFGQMGSPWFLRGILNKKERMEFGLFDYEEGVIYRDIPWRLCDPILDPLRGEVAQEVTECVQPGETSPQAKPSRSSVVSSIFGL